MRLRSLLLLASGLLVACGGASEPATPADAPAEPPPASEASTGPATIRLALFNIEELSRVKLDEQDDHGRGKNPQLQAAVKILQAIRPDVVVLQEIDQPPQTDDPASLAANARLFAETYLAKAPYPLHLQHVFVAPTNTGVPSGLDLDGDGFTAEEKDRGDRRYGNDCFGFGTYPGQYSMAVLSRFPIAADRARTFQRFLWRDLPGNHLPPDFYSAEARARLRLSSKSHWDLVVDLPAEKGTRPLHLWVSHPTPPAFDGPEDRNGRRNFDEVGFWAAYLRGEKALYDDQGRKGGYASREPFVVMGDLNASPNATEGRYDGRSAIDQLLGLPRIQDTGSFLTSAGALAHAGVSEGPPRYAERDTATFLGGRRVDYLLPSSDIEVLRGGVYWPTAEDDAPGASFAERASDHHLVWLDLRLP